MKITSIKLSLLLSLAFLVFGCGSDDESDSSEFDCGGTTCGTIIENIIGTWDVTTLSDDAGTVTFNADGTGSSSSGGEFATTNDGIEYTTFTWSEISIDYDFTITYNFDPGGPITAVTFSYEATLNDCNCVELVTAFFENESSLKRR